MSRLSCSIAILVLLLAPIGSADAQERPDYLSQQISPDAVLNEGARGPATEIVTGFEAPDFVFGPIFGQNGWSVVLGSSLLEGHVDTVNPNTDSQHLRISQDPALVGGANGIFTTSAFSPVLGPQPAAPSQLSVNVAIGAAGGADYRIQAQAVNEMFVTAIMQFNFLGNIFVLDDNLLFVDTGIAWTPGPYVEARIEVDPGAGTVEYFYGGSSIFTTGIIAGTTIDNAIMGGDNFNAGESGDFDDLRFPNAAPSNPTIEIPTLGQMGLVALLLVLAVVGIWRLRRV